MYYSIFSYEIVLLMKVYNIQREVLEIEKEVKGRKTFISMYGCIVKSGDNESDGIFSFHYATSMGAIRFVMLFCTEKEREKC